MSTEVVRVRTEVVGKITDNGNDRVARDVDGNVVATYNKTANVTRQDGRVISNGDALQGILIGLAQ